MHRALSVVLVAVAASACGAPPAAPVVDASAEATVDAPDVVDARVDVPSERAPTPLVDGRFGPSEWAAIRQLSPLPPPPPSPTNAWADDPMAAALGRSFFEDRGFSSNGQVGCVTCHDPARTFTDGRRVAVAVGTGTRNTPTLLMVPWASFVLWDGRADSLWSQPLLALENPREHATTRLAVAHRVATVYRARYEAVFGPLPPLSDAARFPPSGMPGERAWEAMRADDQTAVNRVVANVGKALEAFERTLATRPAPFDRYVAGDRDAMSPAARNGLQHMLLFGCLECHHTPTFSDDRFHALRMPDDPEATRAGGDRGRAAAIAPLLASPFNTRGTFSDYRRDARLEGLTAGELEEGAFRTPSLRGVARTAPYGHAGTLATLADVIRHDAMAGLPYGDPRALGYADARLRPFRITDAQVAELVAFLEALTPDGM